MKSTEKIDNYIKLKLENIRLSEEYIVKITEELKNNCTDIQTYCLIEKLHGTVRLLRSESKRLKNKCTKFYIEGNFHSIFY